MTLTAEKRTGFGRTPFRGSRAIAEGLVTGQALKAAAWQRLYFDVYIRATAFDPDDHRMWCAAAGLLVRRGGCLGGWSAAQYLGVPLASPDAPVWVSVPLDVRMRPRNRMLIQRTPLPASDVGTIDGAAITTPVRTAFDLGRHLPRTDALIALDALTAKVVEVRELEAFATTRWPWPGTRQLRELLPLIEPLTESPMETRLRLLLYDGGLPLPTAQYQVMAPDRRFVARVDLAYPESRVALEYEGDHHRERRQFQQDLIRVNALLEQGWTVLRFSADDVLRHPDRLLRQVAAAIAV